MEYVCKQKGKYCQKRGEQLGRGNGEEMKTSWFTTRKWKNIDK